MQLRVSLMQPFDKCYLLRSMNPERSTCVLLYQQQTRTNVSLLEMGSTASNKKKDDQLFLSRETHTQEKT
jgi:hypothetical protein